MVLIIAIVIALPNLGDPGAVSRVRQAVAKVFKNGWVSPWDATHDWNQFHDSFKCLSLIPFLFCAQSEHSIYRAAFVIFLYEGVYLQTPLFAVSVCMATVAMQENFVGEEFSAKL